MTESDSSFEINDGTLILELPYFQTDSSSPAVFLEVLLAQYSQGTKMLAASRFLGAAVMQNKCML